MHFHGAGRLYDALDHFARGHTHLQRFAVQNHNESAEVVLSDPAGRARLRLSVDPQGTPRMEMLDDAGKVTYHAP